MYKDILFPVDVADKGSWSLVLPRALELVRAFGAQLHVMTVVPDFGMSIVSQYFSDNAEEKMLEDANKAIHVFVKDHLPDDISVQHIVAQGTVYKAIIDTARKTKCDLIVMAAHRPELQTYLLGPNAAKVVRHSEISVLVVR